MPTRGEFAQQLFDQLGLKITSTGVFDDAGSLDGVLSTLADIGVTNGVAPGEFGTDREITRGEAFTFLARALGLATAKSTIPQAAQALVEAGIVKGYGNDATDLGLNDPLQGPHADLLFGSDRVQSFLKQPGSPGSTKGQDIVSDALDQGLRKNDPAFSAFLRAAGIEKAQIRDEIAYRIDQTNREIGRLAAGFDRQREEGVENIDRGFEERGVFRSTARVEKGANLVNDINRQQYDTEEAKKDALDAANRASQAQIAAIQRQIAEERLNAQQTAQAAALQSQYEDQISA